MDGETVGKAQRYRTRARQFTMENYRPNPDLLEALAYVDSLKRKSDGFWERRIGPC